MPKDEQAFVEGRITQLENMIRNAVIIKDTGEVSTVVTLGKTVTFKELPNGDEEAYTIVGSAEAIHSKEEFLTILQSQKAY